MVALTVNDPFHVTYCWMMGLISTTQTAKDRFSRPACFLRAGKYAGCGTRTRRESARDEGSVRCDAALFPQLALLGRGAPSQDLGSTSPPLVFLLGGGLKFLDFGPAGNSLPSGVLARDALTATTFPRPDRAPAARSPLSRFRPRSRFAGGGIGSR